MLPLKFTSLKDTTDFRKHNTQLVFYLMAGGIQDKKIEKNKKVAPFIEEDHGGPPGNKGAARQNGCCALGSQCTSKKKPTM